MHPGVALNACPRSSNQFVCKAYTTNPRHSSVSTGWIHVLLRTLERHEEINAKISQDINFNEIHFWKNCITYSVEYLWIAEQIVFSCQDRKGFLVGSIVSSWSLSVTQCQHMHAALKQGRYMQNLDLSRPMIRCLRGCKTRRALPRRISHAETQGIVVHGVRAIHVRCARYGSFN